MPNFAITPMVLVIPVLFAMIFLELLVSYLKGMKVYRLQDTVTSVNTGLLSQFVNSTGAIISVFMYGAIEQKFGAFEWDVQNPSTWIFSLLLYTCLLSFSKGCVEHLGRPCHIRDNGCGIRARVALHLFLSC